MGLDETSVQSGAFNSNVALDSLLNSNREEILCFENNSLLNQ